MLVICRRMDAAAVAEAERAMEEMLLDSRKRDRTMVGQPLSPRAIQKARIEHDTRVIKYAILLFLVGIVLSVVWTYVGLR